MTVLWKKSYTLELGEKNGTCKPKLLLHLRLTRELAVSSVPKLLTMAGRVCNTSICAIMFVLLFSSFMTCHARWNEKHPLVLRL